MLLFFALSETTTNRAYAANAALLLGEVNWGTDTIKAVLVDTDVYAPDFLEDGSLDDIAAEARVSTAILSGVSITKESVFASDTTFTAVTGATVEALVLYRDTGVAATSELLAYITDGDLFPSTPSGADLTVTWRGGEVIRLSDQPDWPYVRGFGPVAQTHGSGVPLVVDKPTGVVEGDMLICVLALRNGTPTNPAGWDWIVSTSNSGDGTSGRYMAWKLAGSSEPGTYTWTMSSGTDRVGQITAFAGTTGVIVDPQIGCTEVTSGRRRALWVGLAADNTSNNNNVPYFHWTNVSKVNEGHLHYRTGVSVACARVDDGAAITTLSPSVTSRGLTADARASFVLEASL